jgi:hypothetical protein
VRNQQVRTFLSIGDSTCRESTRTDPRAAYLVGVAITISRWVYVV